MGNGNLNKSVLKALEIIELLDVEGALGITEISLRLSLDKSSVFRALNTLKSKYYVRQDPDTLKYSNSFKLFEMGHNVVRETGLPTVASRYMRQLSGQVEGTVNLGVRDGHRAVYIDKIDSESTVRVSLKVGQSLPLYCTGMGKSLMAFLPEEDLRELLGELAFEKGCPNTHDSPDSLLGDLAEVRRRGYAVDDEEHLPGLFCVAAPIFDAGGAVIAAISVASVKMAPRDQAAVENLAHKVIKAAEACTASLGGRHPGLARRVQGDVFAHSLMRR